MSGDVSVLRNEIEVYDDGSVASVRLLSVPESERFPDGLKYAFHYGTAGAENPIIRFDNHHGDHERHNGARTTEIDYPGLAALYRRWRSELPEEKQADW
jgi:hypothetical protein